jgi:hypothetical protein
MSTPIQSEKEKDLRTQYPYMFEHTEAEEDEVYLTNIVADAASVQVEIYRKNGLPSARLGELFLDKLKDHEGDFKFYPIFARLDEFMDAVEADQRKKA